MAVNVKTTLGAILIGGLLSGLLTGVVFMQTVIYFQLYPVDKPRIKTVVILIWTLDALHTSMVFATNWTYLMGHYGDSLIVDKITWTMGLTIAFTAFITFIVHCFFVQRVFVLSKYNWYITTPLLVLAFLRLGSAMVSTIKMITSGYFSSFSANYSWVFTLGLSTSSALDILISSALLYYLRKSRTGFSSMDQVINSLSLYSIESGLAPCIVTVSALICWLTMPHNRIFLGLHFVISKLYANSLLATLNARARIRARSVKSAEEHPILMPLFVHASQRGQIGITSDITETKLQISVERDVCYDVETQREGEVISSCEDLTKTVESGRNAKLENVTMDRSRQVVEHKASFSSASPSSGGSSPVLQ